MCPVFTKTSKEDSAVPQQCLSPGLVPLSILNYQISLDQMLLLTIMRKHNTYHEIKNFLQVSQQYHQSQKFYHKQRHKPGLSVTAECCHTLTHRRYYTSNTQCLREVSVPGEHLLLSEIRGTCLLFCICTSHQPCTSMLEQQI